MRKALPDIGDAEVGILNSLDLGRERTQGSTQRIQNVTNADRTDRVYARTRDEDGCGQTKQPWAASLARWRLRLFRVGEPGRRPSDFP